MPQRFAALYYKCRECGARIYGWGGVEVAAWAMYSAALQLPTPQIGSTSQPGNIAHHFGCCGGWVVATADLVGIEYSFVAPLPDPRATRVNPDIPMESVNADDVAARDAAAQAHGEATSTTPQGST